MLFLCQNVGNIYMYLYWYKKIVGGHTKSLIKMIILEEMGTGKEDEVRVKFTLWAFFTFHGFYKGDTILKIK